MENAGKCGLTIVRGQTVPTADQNQVTTGTMRSQNNKGGKVTKYKVSRVYGIEMSWFVEADSYDDALLALDDDNRTPSDEACETVLGPAKRLIVYELDDRIRLVKK